MPHLRQRSRIPNVHRVPKFQRNRASVMRNTHHATYIASRSLHVRSTPGSTRSAMAGDTRDLPGEVSSVRWRTARLLPAVVAASALHAAADQSVGGG